MSNKIIPGRQGHFLSKRFIYAPVSYPGSGGFNPFYQAVYGFSPNLGDSYNITLVQVQHTSGFVWAKQNYTLTVEPF